jgi:hypothetical protein
MPRLKDITGQRFGLLTVIKRAASIPSHHNSQWECLCECGATTVADGGNLKAGRTKSCGAIGHRPAKYALRKDYKGHGHATIRGTWGRMIQRCTNPKSHNYPMYGGRGIKVCERWRNLSNFVADMGARPSPQHSIDRYPDKNGDYEPGNVRWATPTEQANNTRSNRLLTAFGKTQTVAEWGRETGLGHDIIEQRVRTLRWSAEKAITTPRREWGPNRPRLAS